MGRYLFAQRNGKTFIKLVGEMRYIYSSGFDSFIENLFERDFSDVLIDLSETDFLDSTNLGLIAGISENLQARHQKKPTIVCPDRDLRTMLHNTGFDSAFTIIRGFQVDDIFTEIPDTPESELRTAEMMVKAHKSLIRLAPQNETVYSDVVTMMEDEIEQRRSQEDIGA